MLIKQKDLARHISSFLSTEAPSQKSVSLLTTGLRGRHPAKERKQVQINIGLMVPNGTDGADLRPLRGKTLPLFVDPEVAAPDVLKQAVQKMRTFNNNMQEGPYVLLYPDCSEVVHVPGSERLFKLAEYKKELGKPYSRITFFICLETHFKGVFDTSASDSEIVITSRSTAEFNRADTVVFEPQNQSTPKHKPEDERSIIISDAEDMDSPETNSAKTSCYSKYTDLYAPRVKEEDEELVAVSVENFQHTAVEEMNITLPDYLVGNLSLPIDHKRVSRFSDDAGVFEEGIDTGGPRREFLTLLMKHLKDRPIFDGPEGHWFLVYNAHAVREDEYFLAGKMITVLVVHGGPGPHFLSEDLVHYLAGQPFKSTVNLITDEEVGKALLRGENSIKLLCTENAASVDALQECIMRHSTMLQTTGCLRHVAAVEEKNEIVADYLRWYIIDRNSSVIDRYHIFNDMIFFFFMYLCFGDHLGQMQLQTEVQYS
ncbi:hypothetical protein L3Q82_013538, partial [Scortum barcoo]